MYICVYVCIICNKNLGYSDDVALLASTGKSSERFGLPLNAKKAQVMGIGRPASSINTMYNGAPSLAISQTVHLPRRKLYEEGDTIKEVKRRVAIAKRAMGDLHRISRNKVLPNSNSTEEKTCTVNDLADNELWFRDMDLPKVSTQHDKRLCKTVLPKNVAHLMDGTCHQWAGV